MPSPFRLLVLAVMFLTTSGLVARSLRPESVPLREPLAELPRQLGDWSGRDYPRMTDQVLSVLGVDEYVNRLYDVGASRYASLYVGYYQTQRQGDTIHSPMNCLPGAGWQPMETGVTTISIPGQPEPIVVNRVLIQKGLDRQVALYWYQSHGRVVANEYLSKIYLVLDAARYNRSDAALVRVISPVLNRSVDAADEDAADFVKALFPPLRQFLPS